MKQRTTLLLLLGLFACIFNSFSAGANSTENGLVNGTTGSPLGGFGAGALKFNANNGSFALMTRTPADAYDFKLVPKAGFQFYVQRESEIFFNDKMTAQIIDGRPQDDAIWPLHQVNFGNVGDIQINMTGFSAVDNKDYDRMSLPYAFYEFTLKNTGKTEANAAIALQWTSIRDSFEYIAGKGMASQSLAVFASCPDSKAILSAGEHSGIGFRLNGQCEADFQKNNQAKVAIKIKLKANQTKTLRFVVAWYDDTDPEMAYYFNLCNNAQEAAQLGLINFDILQKNACSLVERFRESNIPDWYKNQTLNTLANLTTNSMYKKDGRIAFAEGQWTCFGTMDQMWHARQIVAQYLPFFAWQELRYWARTQMKNGQIHHDFNLMEGNSDKAKRSVLVDWDDTEHSDYRNIQKWVDLNCALIVSTYETYQITGDTEEFDFMWPYLKKAAQRILDQVQLYGNSDFPYTFDNSENSYDAGGDPNPFNAAFSAVAYKVMTLLAKEKGELDLAEKFTEALQTVVDSYQKRYLTPEGFKTGKHCESFYGGQWLAFHLKLGELWDAETSDFVIQQLDSYYHPFSQGLGYEKGTYDEWTPYILTHYGGLLLNTRRVDQWWFMQKDSYQRQYLNRDKVFDHPLNILPIVKEPKWIATNISSDKQYISMPALWRNYYDMIGYFRDRRTNELWIKPLLPAELNHTLENALFISPEGFGNISCTESGLYYQNKEILVKTDFPMKVSTLYLADNFGENVSVKINGKPVSYQRIGQGYAKELAIKWDGTIKNKGIKISVSGEAGSPPPALPQQTLHEEEAPQLTEKKSVNAYEWIEAEAADKTAGIVVSKENQRSWVASCNNFDYIEFSQVDFGSNGASRFMALVASPQKGVSIEIVLDDVAGQIIGNCSIPDTGGFQSWETASCAITKTTGIHNVILRFSGSSADDLLHIDKFILIEKEHE